VEEWADHKQMTMDSEWKRENGRKWRLVVLLLFCFFIPIKKVRC